MKTLKTTFAILIITLFSISCSKSDDSSTPTTPAADYFLKAKIDGVQYQTDAAFRVLASTDIETITITSVLADNQNFELEIYNFLGIGTYTYPVDNMSLLYGDASSETAIWRNDVCPSTTGTVTITAISTTEVSGTFSFTGKRTGNCAEAPKVITEGSFKSKITQ